MMRKFLLLAALLLSSLALPAQTAREFRVATDSLRARLHRRTTVDSFLKVSKVTKRGTTLDFHFSKELGDYPWRTEDVEWFRKELLDLFPANYRAFALGNIFADKNDLTKLPMPALTASGKPAETELRTGDPRAKSPLVRTDERWSRGLSGRHIALWQSHGRYYEAKTERWEWQRAATFRTVEDLYTQSYVLPFLIPMLENAGACVMTPRERDVQSWEVICDNDPSVRGGHGPDVRDRDRRGVASEGVRHLAAGDSGAGRIRRLCLLPILRQQHYGRRLYGPSPGRRE